MEEEYLTLDKDYLKAFNTGYALSKETGLKAETLEKLKPEQLKKLNISKGRLDIIKDGMKQHAKDIKQGYAQEKSTQIDIKEKAKSKKVEDKTQTIINKLKKEQQKNELKKDDDLNKGFSR